MIAMLWRVFLCFAITLATNLAPSAKAAITRDPLDAYASRINSDHLEVQWRGGFRAAPVFRPPPVYRPTPRIVRPPVAHLQIVRPPVGRIAPRANNVNRLAAPRRTATGIQPRLQRTSIGPSTRSNLARIRPAPRQMTSQNRRLLKREPDVTYSAQRAASGVRRLQLQGASRATSVGVRRITKTANDNLGSRRSDLSNAARVNTGNSRNSRSSSSRALAASSKIGVVLTNYGHGIGAVRITSRSALIAQRESRDAIAKLNARVASVAKDAIFNGNRINVGRKIEVQMTKRGWTGDDIKKTISNPSRIAYTSDRRWNSDGTRKLEPATAYIDRTGNYVVRNNVTGDIVQISDRNNPQWKSPFN